MRSCACGVVLLTISVLGVCARQTNVPAASPGTVVPGTGPAIHLPTVTVRGAINKSSLTSPSIEEAEHIKKEVPGGFTLQGLHSMNQGRVSSLDDLMQDAPGFVTLSENNVEVSKVFIRGSGVIQEDEPIGVQYLMDGLTLNQGDGEIILEDFDVGTVKYAEIYRGANALQYGGLGLGGAVNFVPFTGYDAARFGVRLEGGSFGFARSQLTSGGVDGAFDYFISASARSREGWRDHSDENTELLFTDFGYRLTTNLENRLYAMVDQTRRQLPGALSYQQMEQSPRDTQIGATAEDFQKNWYYVRLADKLAYQSGPEEASVGGYWWHRNAYEPNFYSTDPSNIENEGINGFYSDNFGALLNSTTRAEFLGGENVLTVGFNPTTESQRDAYYQNLNGQKGALTGADDQWSVNSVLYGQWQHYLAEKLSLVAGIQWDYAYRHFYDYFNNTVDGNQSGIAAFHGINPKFGAMYDLTDKDQIFVNYSRSWEPPSFDEMVDFDDSVVGASQTFTRLLPQSAWTVETGARGEDGRFKWELSLYHSWVSDELLDLNNADGIDIGAINAAHSFHQGIEAGLEARLMDGLLLRETANRAADRLTFKQNYTLTDTHFKNDPIYGENRIAGVPIHFYQAQLMYESPTGFYAGPNVYWIMTKYPVDNANLMYTPGSFLLGFRAGYRISKGLEVFVEARNLADQRYASSVDPISSEKAFSPPIQVYHPGDPRSVYGGLSWVW
jgi:iron complex outermembrane receptor protein